MPRDSDQFDLFVSYARKDNVDGWITGFVDGIQAEHQAFAGGRALTCFFDKSEIHTGDDSQHRLDHSLADSRIFLAFISPNYFASEWCRKEWRAWIDVEIAKHVLTDGAHPVYIVEVPGLIEGKFPPEQVAAEVAKLCDLTPPHAAFLTEASRVVLQVSRRQLQSVIPFYQEGLTALCRKSWRKLRKDGGWTGAGSSRDHRRG